MRRKKGNIIFLIAIIIVVGIFIILMQQDKSDADKSINEEAVDLVRLAEDYKTSLRAIMPEYETLLENPSQDLIEAMRQKLLDLKMPAEFRALHAQLVLLLDKIEQGISTDEAVREFEEIVAQYEWLAN